MELKNLLDLIERFSQSDLTELEYKDGDSEVALRRNTQALSGAPAPVHTAGSPAASDAVAGAGKSNPEPALAADSVLITAPIVGTFYRSPSPDAPAFVKEGDTVKAGQTLCILEAMKVMNELEAEFDLEVRAIHVANGTMVEYGTTLMEVRRL